MSARHDYIVELEGFALDLAHTAGGIAEAYFRSGFSVDNKDANGFDPVTSADHAIEKVLRQTIESAYPEHGIVAEESGTTALQAEYCWYIDPIDGTRSFMMGSPLWGTLVGLTESRKPIFGLLAQPILNELYLGSPGASWLITPSGRKRLRASQCADVAKARLAATHPSMFKGEQRGAFDRIADACLLDRFGGDCYNYAMVAAGFVDLVVEASLKPFDIVPLIPLLENAGCIVTDWQGNSLLEGGSVVAAATPALHAQALEILNA